MDYFASRAAGPINDPGGLAVDTQGWATGAALDRRDISVPRPGTRGLSTVQEGRRVHGPSEPRTEPANGQSARPVSTAALRKRSRSTIARTISPSATTWPESSIAATTKVRRRSPTSLVGVAVT